MMWFGKVPFCIILACVVTVVIAQPPSGPVRPGTSAVAGHGTAKDSLERAASRDSVTRMYGDWQLVTRDAGTAKPGNWFINKEVKFDSPDYLFYLSAGMVLVLGLIRYLFPKYFSDLFGLFFRVTFQQKAIRERLLENALPSILLNALFICSAGFFLYHISNYYHWSFKGNFWAGLAFWVFLLAVVYGLKLLLLKAAGWLFQIREASNTYSFIVFMVNKVIGVLLIPVSILLALGPASLQPILVTVSVFLLAGMFLYRYVISYPSVRASVRVNQFHFFLYLCAFEIVPLLLIYKGLAVYFSDGTRL